MNGNNGDCMSAFLLKECYNLAAQYETSDISRDILRTRAKKIPIPDNYVPVQKDCSYPSTTQQVTSEALYELTLEEFSAFKKGVFKNSYKLDQLDTSAEKEFLLALVSLRAGTSETQIVEAQRHILAALSYSPNDPRIRTLAEILRMADD